MSMLINKAAKVVCQGAPDAADKAVKAVKGAAA
jgi:hypothetical protein